MMINKQTIYLRMLIQETSNVTKKVIEKIPINIS